MRTQILLTLVVTLGCGDDRPADNNAGMSGTDSSATGTSTSTAPADTTSGAELPGESSTSRETSAEPSPCTDVVEDDILLGAQADIDALTHLREVRGSLTITGEVTSLDALGCLETIEGSLSIHETQGLQDLVGLDRLMEVGGQVWVTHNRDLQSLDGLASLRFVSVLHLAGNGITSLGLSHLQAAQSIVIGECSFDGQFSAGEPLLEDFDGLESLIALQSVAVYESPMFVGFSGLQAFAQRGGALGSLKLWFNGQLDPAVIADVTDAFGDIHVDACGNRNQDTDACFCPPPP